MAEPEQENRSPSPWRWLGLTLHVVFVALVIGVVSLIFHGVVTTLAGSGAPAPVMWVLLVVQGVATGFLFGMAYRRGKPFIVASLLALVLFQRIVEGWGPALLVLVCLWGGYHLGSRPALHKALERRRP